MKEIFFRKLPGWNEDLKWCVGFAAHDANAQVHPSLNRRRQ